MFGDGQQELNHIISGSQPPELLSRAVPFGGQRAELLGALRWIVRRGCQPLHTLGQRLQFRSELAGFRDLPENTAEGAAGSPFS